MRREREDSRPNNVSNQFDEGDISQIMGAGSSQRNDNRFKPKTVGEKLAFDGVEIEKNVIKERINSELNTLIETRMD